MKKTTSSISVPLVGGTLSTGALVGAPANTSLLVGKRPLELFQLFQGGRR